MIENLPQELALDIFSRLPIISLMQIKCVCKAWYTLAHDWRLSSLHLARASNRNPCLLLHCDSPIQNKLYHVGVSDGPDRFANKVTRIDAKLKSLMPDYHVVGSCNGLLCIFDALYLDPICICNPFVGSHIELPNATPYPEQEVALGFGYHPMTMEYKVVRIAYHVNKHHYRPDLGWFEKSDVKVFTLGMDAWRSLGKISWRIDGVRSEALLNGVLHWVTKHHRYTPSPLHIVSFDLAEEKFKEIELPACGSLSACKFHLVVLTGCLSAIVCSPDREIEIWVMKEYNVKESWTKEYVIGTYLPSSLNQNARPLSRIWNMSTQGKGVIRVLCILKNGEILLEYGGCALVLYNPESEEFRELLISGLSKWFLTFIHIESLFPVEAILGIQG